MFLYQRDVYFDIRKIFFLCHKNCNFKMYKNKLFFKSIKPHTKPEWLKIIITYYFSQFYGSEIWAVFLGVLLGFTHVVVISWWLTSLGLKNPRCPNSHVWMFMRHLGSSPVAANPPVGQTRPWHIMAVSESKKVKGGAASLNSWNHTASHSPYSIGQNKSESQPRSQGSAE